MNKRHHHSNIIERKLEQLPAADTGLLWNDMHLILDKKMPQKKERRRFIVWFITGNGLLLLAFLFLLIADPALFFLSAKQSSPVTINKLTAPAQSDKLVEDGTAKVLQTGEENTTTTSGTDQKTSDILTATAPSAKVDHVANNISTWQRQKKQSQKYAPKDQLSQSGQVISDDGVNSVFAPADPESIHHGLVATEHNVKKYVSRQQEPVADKVRKNPGKNKQSGFYSGIMSGVDLSSIHFQSAKAGATTGLIFGYAFNKKWSIESGLLWDTKRVYDNGRYFNPPGYTPTNGITIVAVNGKSRLYEWPINIKYTILSGKHSLFTTTGLSSYLMRSENYDYEYLQNNQPGGHNYLSYRNATKNWFSVVNFSLGYTHKLGGNGSIRVEPYLKLPIKNLGAGNMPIMSTGLNIGFTKPITR